MSYDRNSCPYIHPKPAPKSRFVRSEHRGGWKVNKRFGVKVSRWVKTHCKTQGELKRPSIGPTMVMGVGGREVDLHMQAHLRA